MGLFDRAERGLERAVNSAFAKAFKSEVQPVEIASAIREKMDDRAAVVGPGRVIVPNRYAVQLSEPDFDRLVDYGETLIEELIVAAEEHRDSQRYVMPGPVRIIIQMEEELAAGTIDVLASSSKPPGRRAPAPQHDDPYRSRATGPRFYAEDGVQTPEPLGADEYPAEPRDHGTSRPYLEVGGQHYPLHGAINILGRDDNADIILEDTGISRRHAEIRLSHDGPQLAATLRDLGSTNGTYLNGERISSSRLMSGDRITLGRMSVTFHLGDGR